MTWILDVPQAVGLYCSYGAAQARQWNISNPSQPNPVREEMGHPVKGCEDLSAGRYTLSARIVRTAIKVAEPVAVMALWVSLMI